eukprot:c28386_g2_i2 orf=1745-2593(+)
MNGMDGGLIEGRTVRVNEVKNRNQKPLGGDNSFRDRDRDRNAWAFRNRDRNGNARRLSPFRSRRASPGALRSTRGRSPARHRGRFPQGGRSPSGSSSSHGRRDKHSSPSVSPRGLDGGIHGIDETSSGQQKPASRAPKERRLDFIKVRDDLEKANQCREELRDKVTSLEEEITQKDREIMDLRIKSQKLEGALTTAVAACSHRQLQLKKLQRAFLQVKDYSEQLKSSERELQTLVELTMTEVNNMGNVVEDDKDKNEADANGHKGAEDMDWRIHDVEINIDN